MSQHTKIGVFLLFLFLCSVTLLAQLNLATLVGTVKDTSGAVVPNATVTLKNLGTGAVRILKTDSSGDYTIPNLDVAHYSLTVTVQGFKTTTIPDFQLEIGQSAKIDPVLQVGATTQEVTVTTAAPLLATTTAEVGQVVERQILDNAPLNGRAFWQLTALTPGANYTPGGSNPYNGLTAIRARAVNVTVNGSDTMKTGWTLDGSNITEVQLGGTEVQPNVDAIQEFKVESGNMGAQFGRTPTTVTATIKSGTNQFHGDVFEFLRNDKLDARNFFFQAPAGSHYTKDIMRRNQFGGTVGGPIKRDKTFFFADYEETMVRQALVASNVVPSMAERQGDFSELCSTFTAGVCTNGTQLLNPFSTPTPYAPFPGNIVSLPTTSTTPLFSPQANFFLGYLPEPNLLQGTTSRAVFGNRMALNTAKGDIKIDENLTSQNRLMGRYSIMDNTEANPDRFPALGILQDHSRGQDFTLVDTHVFNAHWLNEARFGYYRMMFLFSAPLQSTNFSQASEANYQGFDLQLFGGFPEIDLNGYTGFDGSPSNNLPKSNHVRTYEYADMITYNSGKHDIKMGFQLYHNILGFKNGSETQGDFGFVGTYTGDAFADFLLGVPTSSGRDGGQPLLGSYGNFPALFFQDYFRATSNLTLNVGVRWEDNGFYTGQRGQLSGINLATDQIIIPSNFDPTAQAISAELVPLYHDRYVFTKSLGLPLSVRNADKKDFAPRVGFAWKPFGKDKWALRAGYGIFYVYPDNDLINNTVSVPPLAAADTEFNDRPPLAPTRSWGNFYLGVPLAGTPNPNPGQPCPLGFTALDCSTPALATGTFGSQKMTYIQEYNFSLQHELTSSVSLNLAYVGNNSHHQGLSQSANDPPPGPGNIQPRRPLVEWGPMTYYEYGGLANYNALQASVVARRWHGLSLLGNYTYSKCIDNGSNEGGAATTLLIPYWRAVCDLNRAHTAALSYDYQLPFGQGRHYLSNLHGVSNHILGGWEMSGILTLQTGLPYTPNITEDQANTGVGSQNPDVISTPLQTDNVNCWFYTTANSLCTSLYGNKTDWWALPPAATRYGTGGRNILTANGLKNLDFALFKVFKITESKTAEFRAEFFNLTNHPTFSAPSSGVDTGSGGQVGSTLNAARQIQFALKLYF